MKKIIGMILGALLSVWGLCLFIPACQVIGKTGQYTWKPPYSAYERAALDARFYGILLFVAGMVIMLIFSVIIFLTIRNKEINANSQNIKQNDYLKEGFNHEK